MISRCLSWIERSRSRIIRSVARTGDSPLVSKETRMFRSKYREDKLKVRERLVAGCLKK